MRAEVANALHCFRGLFAESFESVKQYFEEMEQLRKPMTNLEIYNRDWREVLRFKESLESLGYYTSFNFDVFRIGNKIAPGQTKDTETVSYTLNISPFKTLVDVARVFGYNDRVADLAGLLVGYSTRDIWDYCVKRGIPVVNPERFLLGR